MMEGIPMSHKQKIFTVSLWGILVLAMVAAIAAGVADHMHKAPPALAAPTDRSR